MDNNASAYLYIKNKGYLLYKANLNELYDSSAIVDIHLMPLKVGDRVILKDILFEFNSTALNSHATKELNEAADFILENPEVTIEIAGHTDSEGDDDYSVRLSKSRAESVYFYFLEKKCSQRKFGFQGLWRKPANRCRYRGFQGCSKPEN